MSAGGIYYAGNTIEARQVTDIGHLGAVIVPSVPTRWHSG
jgi:hypothetical protein